MVKTRLQWGQILASREWNEEFIIPFQNEFMSRKIRLLSYVMKSGEFIRSYNASQAIHKGLIKVDGKVVTDPKSGVKLLAAVKYDGRTLTIQKPLYFALNKPTGVICQKSRKEKTIYDLLEKIPGIGQKEKNSLFSVGRLDKDTSGLLIVTNDGQIEKRIRAAIKTYLVETKTQLTEKDLDQLREGVRIKDEDTGRVFFVKGKAERAGKKIELSIRSGRKRQVRKMIQAVGNEVLALERVGIGNLRLKDIYFQNGRISKLDKNLRKKI